MQMIFRLPVRMRCPNRRQSVFSRCCRLSSAACRSTHRSRVSHHQPTHSGSGNLPADRHYHGLHGNMCTDDVFQASLSVPPLRNTPTTIIDNCNASIIKINEYRWQYLLWFVSYPMQDDQFYSRDISPLMNVESP